MFQTGSSPSQQTFSTVAIIKCKIGYRWNDLSLTKQINCSANGFWLTIQSCERLPFESFEMLYSLKNGRSIFEEYS